MKKKSLNINKSDDQGTVYVVQTIKRSVIYRYEVYILIKVLF